MLAIPVSGWLYSNAAGYPEVWFGWIHLPVLVAKSKPLAARSLGHWRQELE